MALPWPSEDWLSSVPCMFPEDSNCNKEILKASLHFKMTSTRTERVHLVACDFELGSRPRSGEGAASCTGCDATQASGPPALANGYDRSDRKRPKNAVSDVIGPLDEPWRGGPGFDIMFRANLESVLPVGSR